MPTVLYVIQGPTFGGAHVQVERLREPLSRRGWDCLVLLPDEPGNAAGRLRRAGVEVVAMPLHRLRATANLRTHVGLVAGWRREVGAVRQLIRDRGIDLVQVHGPTNPHGAVAAHREGIPVVWQLLDLRAPMPLRRLAMPMVLRLADAVTAYGTALAAAHPGTPRLADRLVPVVPPVDPNAFDSQDRQEARARLGIPAEACTVGTVGIRTPEKAHLDLVKAGAAVRATDRSVVLRVIGGPSPVHTDYEHLVRREANELGLEMPAAFDFVDPDGRVPELLPALDVFALPSRAEGMPTAILEAMVCGLPVVATRVGSVPELVEDGVTGILVPAGDPDALARAVRRLVADPELRAAMGAAGRRTALDRFGLDRVTDAHLRAFEIARAHRANR